MPSADSATAASKRGVAWTWGTRHKSRLSHTEVTVFLRNLATLTSNGVSLPKAIGALAEEKTLEKRRDTLKSLRSRIESGDSFSHVLSRMDGAFDRVTVSQIRVGERAGTLPDTLLQVAEQREKAGRIKEDVVKKLAYPVVLAAVGAAVVAFLLCYVVPVFEKTYESAHVPLPGITRLMIAVGDVAQSYWWAFALTGAATPLLLHQLRQKEALGQRIDAALLKAPIVGPMLRDIALLQLMEVLGCLMEAGFTLAESLEEAGDSVRNRAMKEGVAALRRAVQQGERFSREVERHADLFPPMVSQLVIVGEQTGRLTKSTRQIRLLLEEEIQRKTDLAIGVIEPTLTISMAAAVGGILLAIYLPMFDMINTVG
ncbi:type II secretion system F family protein [Botrimarina colliarenosi]|uniref:type II secretion system F family protein n=1 Tax=Botrimarina colliarenosi TaxID=2528001 RepID=UPI0018D316AB|nr:type II secretion system F family protein [Botrimarina colliarenosi]